MSKTQSKFAVSAAAVGAALLVAACGGGDGGTIAPKASVARVIVIGDSLADVGTFGFKFTVQNAADARGFPIFTQVVASAYGLDGLAQCNFFAFTGTTFVPNPKAGCTNFAVGGGRVFNPASNGGSAAPFDVKTQMATSGQVNGTYKADDLVMIGAGGNDVADLVGAYLGLAAGATGQAAYQRFLLQQLDAATMGGIFAQNGPAAGAGVAAGAYMQRLADTYYNSVKANVLDKGATKVALLNAPDITLTPRFQMVLASVAASQGAAGAAQLQAGIRSWVGAFNTQLKTRVAGDARVALVDFYADFTDQVNSPASYSLSNSKDTACPVTGVGTDGLPSYTFPTCTSAALDARPPTGQGGGWYNSYAFSDGFHPTPYGHKLLGASVSRALARAGFL